MKAVAAATLLPLSLCLLLIPRARSIPRNSLPCQHTTRNNAHNIFLHRHVRDGTPPSLDPNAWGRYLRDNKDCGRPTQSFLRQADRERVHAVCGAGGRVYKGNLCISGEKFDFVTVRSEPGTCGVRSVRSESKHLILACEALENRCLPVHFEGNPGGVEPSQNAPVCGDPLAGRGTSRTGTWLQVVAVLIVNRMVLF